jgi:uncharacterized membrane protein
MTSNRGLISQFFALLKRHFFAGLLVLAPLGVIAWIVVSAAGALWRLHLLLPESWRPDPEGAAIFDTLFTLGAALVLALAISALGWASKQYLGEKLLEVVGHLIERIPVIRGVYSALNQLLKTMAADGSQQFNRVVYLEYPRKGVWAIAFVTSPAKGRGVPAGHLNVYVPTTPNPTSGFHLIVPEADVRDAHMAVEEAFKTLLSLGIAQPTGGDARGPA